VNGADVTASDSSGDNLQPGANETSIFAYSENSPWNQGICYNGAWCASEFSVGGFPWQNRFIGRIDEAKVWNVTQDAAYFAAYDAQTAPYISAAEGLIGNARLQVTFSEGVYANPGGSGALEPSDLALADANNDNPRTIVAVAHTPGSATAIITMSQPLAATDVSADTLAAALNSIYDEYNNVAGTTPVTIGLSSQCPEAPVSIPLNEPAGNPYVMDTQSILYGVVSGADTLTGSAYSGGGDGDTSYINFPYNGACLDATTAITLEARIRPTGMSGAGNYIRRIFSRGNYQMSVWRNNTWGSYNAPSGTASIAFWVQVVNAHGGNAWKPVLTNYTTCPIVSDHWYQVRTVWNSTKPGGVPGQFFVPADIWIDDQGTDGSGAGENWPGEANCTRADQAYHLDASRLYTEDAINRANSAFTIGANVNNYTNVFNGLIDWIAVNAPAYQFRQSLVPSRATLVYLPMILK
jgi:hypothetical protein